MIPSTEGHYTIGNTCVIACTGCLANVYRISVSLVEDLISLENLYPPDLTQVVLVVTRDNVCLRETLLYNNTTVLELMKRHLLILHMDSIICFMRIKHSYGLFHMRNSGDSATNRRLALLECSTSDTTRIIMPPGGTVSIQKPMDVFYANFKDPLEQFGPGYLYVVFASSLLLDLPVSDTLYISRYEATVLISQLV